MPFSYTNRKSPLYTTHAKPTGSLPTSYLISWGFKHARGSFSTAGSGIETTWEVLSVELKRTGKFDTQKERLKTIEWPKAVR